MTDLTPPRDLTDKLVQVMAACDPADRAHKAAARLFDRLTTPIRIGIIGPFQDDTDALNARLNAIVKVDNSPLGAVFSISPLQDCEDFFETTDIALWCTREFSDPEQAIWDQAPDTLKDHSYLVGFDLAPGAPPPARDRLRRIAEAQFLEFAEIPHSGDANLVNDLYRRLAARVALGRQAALDHAALLVDTHQPAGGFAVPAPTKPAAETTAETQNTRSHSTCDPAVEKALSYLRDRATSLGAISLENSQDTVAEVLQFCAESAEGLADLVGESMLSCQSLRAFGDGILASTDSLQLMAIEDSMQAAVDAVSVLLQIRKDLVQRAAA